MSEHMIEQVPKQMLEHSGKQNAKQNTEQNRSSPVPVPEDLYSPSIPTSSNAPAEPRPDVDGWAPGDVVVLDTGEVLGLMAADVINPWVLLNEEREDGDNFDETVYIEDHHPMLIARAGSPVGAS